MSNFLPFLPIMLIFLTSQTTPILALRCLPTKPSSPTTTPTTPDFLRSSCSAATYPDLCYASLSAHSSSIKTSPHMVAHTALSVTLTTALTATGAVARISRDPRLRPHEAAAVGDCLEAMSDAVEQLQRAMGECRQLRVKSKEFGFRVSNIQTWVSAAMTNADTCNEGVDEGEVRGRVKRSVRRRVEKVSRLTSNALALINKYALIHGGNN